MNKLWALLIGTALLCVGCGSDQADKTGQSDQSVSVGQVEQNDQKPEREQTMEERGLRRVEIPSKVKDVKIPKPTPQKWAMITSDLWHYSFALTVTEVPDHNIYEGYWIDFHDDGTYDKGLYDEKVGEGVFTYNNDKKLITIYPTKGDDSVKEWEVMTNGEVLILVGTNTYGNNSEQIKLERSTTKPMKKVQ